MGSSKDQAQMARSAGSLTAARQQMGAAGGNSAVTVSDWAAECGPNGLTQSCTVTAASKGASITGVGLLLFSADGQTQYGTQYTAAVNTGAVYPSVTIGGVQLKSGTQIMATVFGYVQGQQFFFEQQLKV